MLAVALFVGLLLGVKWVNYRLSHAISNAAFVESDSMVNLAYERVGGRVERLYKEEVDYVGKGELLAKLEDKTLKLKLQEIEHRIRALEEEREALVVEQNRLKEELRIKEVIAREGVSRARKKLEALEISLKQLNRDWERFKTLHAKGVVPARRFEEIDTQREKLVKEIEALRSALRSALEEKKVIRNAYKNLKVLDKRIASLEQQISALKRKAEDVRELIGETELRAPFGGYIVKRFVREGEVIRQGQYVYSLLNPEDIYILVLLEENKLDGVKEGNKVKIKIDALPDEEYEGVVSVINMATASKFALIPRDITAGEFTKVAQRIPVRVDITKGKKKLLRVGFGAEVSIEKLR
jgi:membrane fusion protein (multidrug efflux system)